MPSIFVWRAKAARASVPSRLIWRLINQSFFRIITKAVCGHGMPTLLVISTGSPGGLQLRPPSLTFSRRRLVWQRSPSRSPECRPREEFPRLLREASLHGFIVGRDKMATRQTVNRKSSSGPTLSITTFFPKLHKLRSPSLNLLAFEFRFRKNLSVVAGHFMILACWIERSVSSKKFCSPYVRRSLPAFRL